MLQILLLVELEGIGRCDIQVQSAGVLQEAAGKPAHEHSIACMQKLGFDLTDHQSRWIGTLDLSVFKLIICLEEGIVSQVKEMCGDDFHGMITVANRDKGGVPNPYQKDLSVYQQCASVLQTVAKDIVRTCFS